MPSWRTATLPSVTSTLVCVSVSPGALGAFGANHHLRQSLVFLDMHPLQQPEMYIGGAASLFDQDGRIAVDATRQLAERFLQAFEKWIQKMA